MLIAPPLRPYPLPTPLPPDEALRRIWDRDRPFLLDGAADADGLGRMSYAGCDPRARHLDLAPEPPPRRGRPAPALQRLQATLAAWSPLVAVGVLSYDLGRAIERLPGGPPDDIGVAPVDLAGYDALYAWDGARAFLLATCEEAAARLRRTLCRPAPPLPAPLLGAGQAGGRPRFALSKAAYGALVARVREHLLAGDCYQVNLCRRLIAPLSDEGALPLYLRLRAQAPAPLGACLRLDRGVTLLSNTPELLLSADLRAGVAQTRPIKGTRRRDPDPAADRALAEALLASQKDHAEHLMIVDLLRNDLGRVAQVGSVQVEGYARLLTLPTVHHLVSTVLARPRPGVGWAELLAALVPGGSITGAPKVRAMEIIDALEPVRRGPFYGAVGWLAPEGGVLALCIRTAVVRGGELVLSVGGGVVLGSTPSEEAEETEVKAAAFLRALS
jgi:para-aminobenzoate synthetase component 1